MSIEATLPGSTTPVTVGQIGLTRFINKAGLQPIGDNLFTDTPASGAPQDGIANTDGFGDMQQSNLEQANVEVVTEISDLIAAQRADHQAPAGAQGRDRLGLQRVAIRIENTDRHPFPDYFGGRLPTGFAIAIPPGYEGQVRMRSGLAHDKGLALLNAPGTVDEGYRGEILVNLVNLDRREPFTIRRGDRIAQLVVQRVERVTFVEVDSLDETGRGDTGHGSTGGFGPGGAAWPTRGETPGETPREA